jgi:hypothetical protein
MDYLYGKLNYEVVKVNYQGNSTATAKITIDNTASPRTIQVDVLKTPAGLSVTNKEDSTVYTFDGSEAQSIVLHAFKVVKASTLSESTSLAEYYLTEDGSETGTRIIVPKDKYVKTVSLSKCTSPNLPYVGAAVGDYYLETTFENSINVIYTPLNLLVDVVNNSLKAEVTRAENAEKSIQTALDTHKNDQTNPHKVTKTQIGLGNVDNTSDANKPVSTAQKTYIDAGDNKLQGQIDTINATQNVVDIVGTHAALIAYVTTDLKENDKIEVIADETQSNADTIYSWVNSAWVLVGKKGPYYTKSETDSTFSTKTELTTETTRAQAAEKTNADAIVTEKNSRTTADNTLQTSITEETTRAKDAETTLQTNIDNAQTTLQTNINNEQTARTNADNDLQSQITAETTRAEKVESAIQADLDTIKPTVYSNLLAVLQSNINPGWTVTVTTDTTNLPVNTKLYSNGSSNAFYKTAAEALQKAATNGSSYIVANSSGTSSVTNLIGTVVTGMAYTKSLTVSSSETYCTISGSDIATASGIITLTYYDSTLVNNGNSCTITY